MVGFQAQFTTAVGSARILPVVQEHECFQEELRKAQRKLLKVSRDKRRDTLMGGGKPEGDVAPVDLHSDPILEWATNA